MTTKKPRRRLRKDLKAVVSLDSHRAVLECGHVKYIYGERNNGFFLCFKCLQGASSDTPVTPEGENAEQK